MLRTSNIIHRTINLILSTPLLAMVSLSRYVTPYTSRAAISPPRMGATQ